MCAGVAGGGGGRVLQEEEEEVGGTRQPGRRWKVGVGEPSVLGPLSGKVEVGCGGLGPRGTYPSESAKNTQSGPSRPCACVRRDGVRRACMVWEMRVWGRDYDHISGI